MRLHRVRLTDYRGVGDADIVLDPDGVTVIEGANEVGKSSVAEAVGLVRAFHDSSRAREVVAVKPVGLDAGPTVELEITTGPYHLVYRKRFLKRPTTELRVLAPRPEQHSGRQADERVDAIFAETLDPELWDALQMVQGESFQQPVLARIEPLRAALGAAAGGATEAHQGLLDAIEQEYSRSYTPMGRPRGDHAALASRLQILAGDLDVLDAEHRGVTERLERFEDNQRWLQEHAVADATSADELSRLRVRHELVAGLHQRIEDRGTALDDATVRADEAAERRGDRDRQRTDVCALTHALQTATADLDVSQARVEQCQGSVDEARPAADEAASAARRKRQGHRDAVDRADDARSAVELRELQERERLARAAREEIVCARAYLDSHAVDDDAVDALVEAQSVLAAARAADEAAAAQLGVRLLGAGAVLVDGIAVQASSQRPVLDATSVVVPGTVEVTVTPGRQARGLADAVDAARDSWEALLRHHGVADLSEARASARLRRTHLSALDHAERALARALGEDDLEAITARCRSLAQRHGASGRIGPDDVVGQERAAKDARDAADHAEERAREAAAALAACDQRLAAARESHARQGQRVEHARDDLARADQRLAESRARLADNAVADAAGAARAVVEEARQALRDAERSAAVADADEVAVLLAKAEAVDARRARDRRQVEDEQQQILGQLSDIEARGLQDRREEVAAELEDTRRAYDRLGSRAHAAALLRETMHRHREAAHTRYVAPFKQAVERLGRVVFGSDFSVEITPDLAIESRTRDGSTVPFRSLSGGAKEQLAVIGRLACAQLVSADEGAPVILDDSLGFSDPARLGRLAAVLHDVGRTAQIIVLTCQPSRFSGIGGATIVRLPLDQAAAS